MPSRVPPDRATRALPHTLGDTGHRHTRPRHGVAVLPDTRARPREPPASQDSQLRAGPGLRCVTHVIHTELAFAPEDGQLSWSLLPPLTGPSGQQSPRTPAFILGPGRQRSPETRKALHRRGYGVTGAGRAPGTLPVAADRPAVPPQAPVRSPPALRPSAGLACPQHSRGQPYRTQRAPGCQGTQAPAWRQHGLLARSLKAPQLSARAVLRH